jgi:hypothetical protein
MVRCRYYLAPQRCPGVANLARIFDGRGDDPPGLGEPPTSSLPGYQRLVQTSEIASLRFEMAVRVCERAARREGRIWDVPSVDQIARYYATQLRVEEGVQILIFTEWQERTECNSLKQSVAHRLMGLRLELRTLTPGSMGNVLYDIAEDDSELRDYEKHIQVHEVTILHFMKECADFKETPEELELRVRLPAPPPVSPPSAPPLVNVYQTASREHTSR